MWSINRLIFAALAWLCFQVPVDAAISLVQQKSNGAASCASVSVTLSAGVTAGNFVFVGVSTTSGAITIAITDTDGDAETDSGKGNFSGHIGEEKVGAFFSPTAGVTTFTATFSGGTAGFCEILVGEVAGISSPQFDKVVIGQGTTGATMSSGSTGTLSAANEFVAGYMISANGATGAGQPSGWTIDLTANSNALVFDSVTMPTAVTATAAQGSGDFDAWAFTFMGSSSPPPTGGTKLSLTGAGG